MASGHVSRRSSISGSELLDHLVLKLSWVIALFIFLITFWEKIKAFFIDICDHILYLWVKHLCWKKNGSIRKGCDSLKDDKTLRNWFKEIAILQLKVERNKDAEPYLDLDGRTVRCPIYYRRFRGTDIIRALRAGMPLAYNLTDCGFKILRMNEEPKSRKALELYCLERIVVKGKLCRACERAFQRQKRKEFKIETVARTYTAIGQLHNEWKKLQGIMVDIFIREAKGVLRNGPN